MSDQTEPKCTAYHATVPPEATGRIRYVQRDGREVISNPLCDWHQGEGCAALRVDERRGEIREVGAVPLDCRKRMTRARHADREQRIAERTRDLMDEIVSVELHPINLDPYPGTVGDVADEIARYVLELEASGVARGLAGMVRERLDAKRAHPDLFNEDPNCNHEIVDGPGGGIRCTKCDGWYCL